VPQVTRDTKESSMATIQRDILIDGSPDEVWAAVRDVGQAHKRLTPGVLVDCRLDGDARTVTFASGMVARELIIAIDDEARRVAYAVQGEPFRHHNASMQVFADGEGSRLVWITDLLPNELVAPIGALVDQGAAAMRKTLGSRKAA
jgi:carbon monoxide dehydrogenase subunit G